MTEGEMSNREIEDALAKVRGMKRSADEAMAQPASEDVELTAAMSRIEAPVDLVTPEAAGANIAQVDRALAEESEDEIRLREKLHQQKIEMMRTQQAIEEVQRRRHSWVMRRRALLEAAATTELDKQEGVG